jgi:hypothetical protein
MYTRLHQIDNDTSSNSIKKECWSRLGTEVLEISFEEKYVEVGFGIEGDVSRRVKFPYWNWKRVEWYARPGLFWTAKEKLRVLEIYGGMTLNQAGEVVLLRGEFRDREVMTETDALVYLRNIQTLDLGLVVSGIRKGYELLLDFANDFYEIDQDLTLDQAFCVYKFLHNLRGRDVFRGLSQAEHRVMQLLAKTSIKLQERVLSDRLVWTISKGALYKFEVCLFESTGRLTISDGHSREIDMRYDVHEEYWRAYAEIDHVNASPKMKQHLRTFAKRLIVDCFGEEIYFE